MNSTNLLSVELTKKIEFEKNGSKHFAQLGKVKNQDEWHLYINNERHLVTKITYNKCFHNELEMKEIVSSYL